MGIPDSAIPENALEEIDADHLPAVLEALSNAKRRQFARDE
jgi:hypothetical protein